MDVDDARIDTALRSIGPTTKRPAWHGAPTLIGVLRGVSPTVALWRPHPNIHCIWQIALHAAFFKNSVANRLSHESNRFPRKLRPDCWPSVPERLTAKEWRDDGRLVADVHRRLVDVVAAFDPAKLDRPPVGVRDRPAIQFIHGIAEHDLYHTGQIKVLKRFAKESGVK